MRVHWIMSILSTLVSLVLLMIIMGQHEVLNMLNTRGEALQTESARLDNDHKDQDLFKTTVEKLVAQGSKVVEDLEAAVSKLGLEIEKKTTENDGCQAEKKTKADELASTEKERGETEGRLKAESDAWNQEINTLKAQLAGRSPICDHAKKDPTTLKLCDTEPAEPVPKTG